MYFRSRVDKNLEKEKEYFELNNELLDNAESCLLNIDDALKCADKIKEEEFQPFINDVQGLKKRHSGDFYQFCYCTIDPNATIDASFDLECSFNNMIA